MIYITGDLHGEHDIHKLTARAFPEGKTLTRSDYLIICGDFGLVWDGSKTDKHWLDWLNAKPWTTLWIDGNHENFDLLGTYPIETWHGGNVQYIRENILHLCRGSVFELEGLTFFAFGGAESHDKAYRKAGCSWWAAELPNAEEMERGRQSLAAHDWKVDVVLTHSLPLHVQKELFRYEEYGTNALLAYFDEIDKRLDYRLWFSGHYHLSKLYDCKHVLIYDAIVRLNENGFVRVYPKEEGGGTLPTSYSPACLHKHEPRKDGAYEKTETKTGAESQCTGSSGGDACDGRCPAKSGDARRADRCHPEGTASHHP